MSSGMNLSKINIMEWFMKYFDVYINRSAIMEEKYMTSFFASEERQFSKCAHLKIEQKKKIVDLDFTYLANLPGGGHDTNPYETISIMQKVIYEDFFKNLPNVVESKFQLLREMRTETSERRRELGTRGNFF